MTSLKYGYSVGKIELNIDNFQQMLVKLYDTELWIRKCTIENHTLVIIDSILLVKEKGVNHFKWQNIEQVGESLYFGGGGVQWFQIKCLTLFNSLASYKQESQSLL